MDPKSAYDKILIQSVFKYASQAGTRDHGLLYINNRLKNTKTIVEYNNILMGFTKDRL